MQKQRNGALRCHCLAQDNGNGNVFLHCCGISNGQPEFFFLGNEKGNDKANRVAFASLPCTS